MFLLFSGSKYLVENAIEMNEDCRTFDLHEKSLTSLYHLDHMTLATSLDLSGNCLSSVQGLHMLPQLVTLNLDNNGISNCVSIGGLDSLEELSIRQNCILFIREEILTDTFNIYFCIKIKCKT